MYVCLFKWKFQDPKIKSTLLYGGSRKNGSVIFNFVINIIQVVLDRVDETRINFGIDAESDIDSDTEWTFSNISKLEPDCFEPNKSNVSKEDSSKSEKEPTQNLTQGIGNEDWCRCGNCRAMEKSENIWCQDQKEVRKNVVKVMVS